MTRCDSCARPALIREGGRYYCELHYAYHLQRVKCGLIASPRAVIRAEATAAVWDLKILIKELKRIYREQEAA